MAAAKPSFQQVLSWGAGPMALDVFLDPTCPFCARTVPKLMPLLQAMGERRLTLRLFLYDQPWHLWSGPLIRCILGAALVGGPAQGLAVLEAITAHRDDFTCTQALHAEGPAMDMTPRQVVRKVSALTGLDLAEPYGLEAVTTLFRQQTRYGRQNGVWMTPTFMVNGLVQPSLESGQSVEAWVGALSALG
ncbi:DsbA family protein [Formicincola oecophyllae]|nr:thioredoxin domain-containing protein [Formicincola oecophyllae]